MTIYWWYNFFKEQCLRVQYISFLEECFSSEFISVNDNFGVFCCVCENQGLLL